jgi:microcystin-dependent protein
VSEPFLAEIRMFSFNFVPRGWAICAGQVMPINQNAALFSLLGTTYGGDGRTTFALPNLLDRAPVHVDSTHGTRTLGEVGGEAAHTLTVSELPTHTHTVLARNTASTSSPAFALWGSSAKTMYASSPTVTMGPTALGTAGNSQAHDNMPPYLAITFGIALVGIFPSRN